MKKSLKVFLVASILGLLFGFQNRPTLEGMVIDSSSGHPIQNAQLRLIRQDKTTLTDRDGLFSFNCEIRDGDRIEISAVGYKTLIKTIKHKSFQTIALIPNVKFKANTPTPSISDSGIQMHKCKLENEAYLRETHVSDEYSLIPGINPYSQRESYDKIHENEWMLSVHKPYSTFSIDVDAASYSNVRRFLNRGVMPPADAVRIEEMINYFNYNYPDVKEEKNFSIYTETGTCPWAQDHQLLHIGIKGRSLEEDKIPASNLVFLIDVSGSMRSENKLPLLKRAFTLLIDNLRDQDRISILTYAGTSGIQAEGVKGAHKQELYNVISGLNAGGSTAGAAGLISAYKLASRYFISEGNNRVILATDGDFNVGASSDEEMVELIEKERNKGIFLTVLGFGMGNYKDSKMQKLADHGNGQHAYIDNFHEARKIFENELQSSLFTIAKDVKIQIEFNPAYIQAYRLIGYENRVLQDKDFNDDKKDAGEIGAGHTVTALYEIVAVGSDLKSVYDVDPPKYQKENRIPVGIKNNEMALLKIRYKEPLGQKSTKEDWIIRPYDSKRNDQFSNEIKWSAAMAVFGFMLRDSDLKGNSSYDLALQLAIESKGEDNWGYRSEAINLIRTAASLDKDRNDYGAIELE